MNIGDYIYLYLFDLEKSIINMNRLRDDRFGKLVDKSILHNPNGNHVVQYDIELFNNGKIVQYRSDSLSINMIRVNELIELIERIDMPFDKKEAVLEQIQEVIKD